jgi:hypothetical protein
MKMTKDDYRRFVCVVVGDNPDELMKEYDSKKNVDKYLVYRYEDAEKIRKQYIDMYERVVASENISQNDREDIKDMLDNIKNVSSDDFYLDLTLEYDLDEDTGDAYSTKNPNGRWSEYGRGGSFSLPLVLKDGTTTFSAKKGDVDWSKVHRHGVETYTAVWETVVEGRKPANEFEEKLYNNMKNANGYFQKFGTKENYVASCTAFWGYAFLSKDKGWLELEPNVNQFVWMNGFYDNFIAPLPDDATITIFECLK